MTANEWYHVAIGVVAAVALLVFCAVWATALIDRQGG